MKKVLKWTLRIVGGLIGLVVVGLGVVYAWTEMEMNETYDLKSDKIIVSTDSITLDRGYHLATNLAKCVDCHKEDFAGSTIVDDPVLGRLVAPNLTKGKGSVTANYTDEDWVRSIRYGIDPKGRPLIFMPSHEYWHFDDAELGAIISYVKSKQPVDRENEKIWAGPLIRTLFALGQVDMLPVKIIDHDGPRPVAPPPGPTAEYGKHLAATGGCINCHGQQLSGGRIPGTPPEWPPARNLTPHATGLGAWKEADFFKVLRTGIRPDGSKLDDHMPWKYTAKMSDDEIMALWRFLRTVEPREAGNR